MSNANPVIVWQKNYAASPDENVVVTPPSGAVPGDVLTLIAFSTDGAPLADPLPNQKGTLHWAVLPQGGMPSFRINRAENGVNPVVFAFIARGVNPNLPFSVGYLQNSLLTPQIYANAGVALHVAAGRTEDGDRISPPTGESELVSFTSPVGPTSLCVTKIEMTQAGPLPPVEFETTHPPIRTDTLTVSLVPATIPSPPPHVIFPLDGESVPTGTTTLTFRSANELPITEYIFDWREENGPIYSTVYPLASPERTITHDFTSSSPRVFEWRVRVKESSGTYTDFCEWRRVTVSDPVPPTFLSPRWLIPESPCQITWDCPFQDGYQVKIHDKNGQLLSDSGEIVSSVRSANITVSDNQTVMVSIRVQVGGTWTAYRTRKYESSFTVPSAPTVSTILTPENYAKITVSNVGQGTVGRPVVYRQQKDGDFWVDSNLEKQSSDLLTHLVTRPLAGGGWTFVDMAVSPGVTYRYSATTTGENGKISDSWNQPPAALYVRGDTVKKVDMSGNPIGTFAFPGLVANIARFDQKMLVARVAALHLADLDTGKIEQTWGHPYTSPVITVDGNGTVYIVQGSQFDVWEFEGDQLVQTGALMPEEELSLLFVDGDEVWGLCQSTQELWRVDLASEYVVPVERVPLPEQIDLFTMIDGVFVVRPSRGAARLLRLDRSGAIVGTILTPVFGTRGLILREGVR